MTDYKPDCDGNVKLKEGSSIRVACFGKESADEVDFAGYSRKTINHYNAIGFSTLRSSFPLLQGKLGRD